MKKFIISIIFLSLLIPLFAIVIKNYFYAKPEGPITLSYWGFEEESVVKPSIIKYEAENPNTKINYVKQSLTNYRTRLQTQVREGVGPDVFRIHNSWTRMFLSDLSPAPPDIFDLIGYKNTFYPVAVDSFVKNNAILAAPMEVDGLGLFVNEELLKNVGVEVPKTWQEFINVATKVTVKDSSGVIQTAGAALGTASNVDHFSDILGLLLLQQPGVNIESPASPAVAEVFKFYTGFVLDPRRKTWDVNLPSSTQMFAQGRLAFYFAPSWRAHELRIINPNLTFKVVPVPQLPSSQVGWGSFWGEGVSIKSKNQKEAWKFVKFLTDADSQRLAYQSASQIRLFGEPYSRIDLAGELKDDPIAGVFVTQGPIYKFWYLASNTFDAGINDEMIKTFENSVNAILQGTSAEAALQSLNPAVKQVLDKYGTR